jgi:hypothetical protein
MGQNELQTGLIPGGNVMGLLSVISWAIFEAGDYLSLSFLIGETVAECR